MFQQCQLLLAELREVDLKRYFSVKREILKVIFAFDRINYASTIRISIYILKKILRMKKIIARNLATNGQGASNSGV